MKKNAVIALLLILFGVSANAQEDIPRITFGAEWSFVMSGFTAWHVNFFSPDGYRYDRKGNDTDFTGNGEALLHVGWNLNEKWNLSLYSGFTGITTIHNAIPVSLRATYAFRQTNGRGDRWFSFADAGTGIGLKKQVQEIISAKVGTGYRISLSRNTKIDFLLAVRCTYAHPQIYFENEEISQRWTNRNDALVASTSIGMALTF